MNRPLVVIASLAVAAVAVVSSRPPLAVAAPAEGVRWAVIPIAPGGAYAHGGHAILLDTATGETWTNVNAAGTWAKMSR